MHAEVFVGPTAAYLAPGSLSTVFDRVSGPIQAGDLDERLRRSSTPGTFCLVDGYLEPGLALSNNEIVRALAAGWKVWGVSSVGAAKAVELRGAGMRGFGRVYRFLQRYQSDLLDELVVSHNPEPPYRRLSEPLIEIRALLGTLRRQGCISSSEATRIRQAMQERWFGERTLAALRKELGAKWHDPACRQTMEASTWRWKRRDFHQFCQRQPWMQPS